ncbi:response regulator [Isachenkonia alkalipeptolytica]|uniref:Stage 0 sporulation protein A homolog n=1 Tax=Isachenkonia alkalipeptolytica TaxID=2565777 RepID=A0AA44BCG9_9CLOT|nr:response regulator [Isachenkonia alkalipeptolytica]NBG86967.1 response regulator [Isachenkonia alkalipeptolytica]
MKISALIMGSITSLRQSIKYALASLPVDFYEYRGVAELLEHVENPGKEESIIVLMDMDSREEDRFQQLKKIRLKNPYVPVLALTGDTEKEHILALIMGGASEIVAKPFSEGILIEKTKKLIEKKEGFATEEIHTDFPALLRKELFKAQKGNYRVSMMIASFFKVGARQNKTIENEYYRFSFSFKEEIEKLLFETDHFLQYGNQTFVGILPFCDQQKREIVEKKIRKGFDELKEKHPELKDYQFALYFTTYPEEGEEAKTLTEKLTGGLQRSIDDLKDTV